MKGKSKRIVSGFLSALTIISSIMQPVTTYAAEAEPAAYEAEYPDMEKVKGALAEDEIVTAEDYEVEAGTGFDVKSDLLRNEDSSGKSKGHVPRGKEPEWTGI